MRGADSENVFETVEQYQPDHRQRAEKSCSALCEKFLHDGSLLFAFDVQSFGTAPIISHEKSLAMRNRYWFVSHLLSFVRVSTFTGCNVIAAPKRILFDEKFYPGYNLRIELKLARGYATNISRK